MSSKFISAESVPNYLALSSDIDGDNKIAGCVLVGRTVFLTDTAAWKIINNDTTVSDYALPATFSGTISLGDVSIDQSTKGTTDAVTTATSATVPDALGNSGALLRTYGGSVNTAPLISLPMVFNGTTWDKLRGSSASGMLTSRSAIEVSPADQVTTNSFALIVGSTLDTLNNLAVSFTVENTGVNSIDWKVLGGNVSDLSDGVEVQASATILTTAFDSYSSSVAVFRYYGVQVKSTVPASVGTAVLHGITKG